MSNPLKILIIEDNLDTRELLHYYFTNAGYSVPQPLMVRKGSIWQRQKKPDLIITDVTMPNMDGIEMIKQIRADSEIAHIPILVFTAANGSPKRNLPKQEPIEFFISLLISMNCRRLFGAYLGNLIANK
jgi:CheY-like chemotaxis protein